MTSRSQVHPEPATPTARQQPFLDSLSPDHASRSARSSFSMSNGDIAGVVRPRRSNDDSRSTSRSTQLQQSEITHNGSAVTTSKHDRAADTMSVHRLRSRLQSPWACTKLTLAATVVALSLAALMIQSFFTRQLDPKGAAMSYMRPDFVKFDQFDTEHTRFASKYSLYLYREGGIHFDNMVRGIPVLFITGNAGSYKQVRPLAAEAAVYYDEVMKNDQDALDHGKRPLDFFSVDFNEDITAFHGQTLLEQAEYLNEAVAYILSLYHTPGWSARDADLPDPTSVILVGHSMGGIVARTMLTIPNYRPNTVNTIITLAAPHARAPVSFDADIVSTYSRVNGFWRNAYSQKLPGNNPLRHVATISIAGGGLDTIVPSDYATLASLVPPSHGFTVFTTTIPMVWTGMDHLAITWCDQLRKAIIPAIFDVVDASRPNQTRTLDQRMRAFRKRFLTGIEAVVEPTLPEQDARILLALDEESSIVVPQGESLTLRILGHHGRAQMHVMPVPPQGSPDKKMFTLLTDQQIGGNALDVFFCSVYPFAAGQAASVLSMGMSQTDDSNGSTRLACRDASPDRILLPASTANSRYPFDDAQPFNYLQYSLKDLTNYEFVAIVDKIGDVRPGWVMADFSSSSEITVQTPSGFVDMLSSGLEVTLPADRALVNEIKIPSVHSSLLAYKLKLDSPSCPKYPELFAPLVRQHIADPYESKYFVNARDIELNMHGLAPFIPPALQGNGRDLGLTLQFWTDPNCGAPTHITMEVDIVGSMGKLWMRYRTAFAAFPLLVVALVLRKQFQRYDRHGTFMSFTESMDLCLRTSIPVLLIGLTLLAMSLSQASQGAVAKFAMHDSDPNATESVIDFTINDLLLGCQDPFFWFLVPLIGIISIGVCVALNYATLCITYTLSTIYTGVIRLLYQGQGDARVLDTFSTTSFRRRIIMTSILLLLVASVIPYQFVFVVLCLVQMATCARALSVARISHTGADVNFYNYVHSILLLMLWILPINIPVLVVWVRNLAMQYLMPFSSHHNILSIVPFILLVEMLSTGKMVPQVRSWIRHLTNMLFFALAVYAAVYGITFAYLLHAIVNLICSWLTAIHVSDSGVFSIFGGEKRSDKTHEKKATMSTTTTTTTTKKRP